MLRLGGGVDIFYYLQVTEAIIALNYIIFKDVNQSNQLNYHLKTQQPIEFPKLFLPPVILD